MQSNKEPATREVEHGHECLSWADFVLRRNMPEYIFFGHRACRTLAGVYLDACNADYPTICAAHFCWNRFHKPPVSEALELGLVSTVVPKDKFETQCMEKLTELAALPPPAVAATR